MDIKEIAKICKEIRERKKISLYRVAKDSKLHLSTIYAIERGDSGYSVKSFMSYCDAVGIYFNIGVMP